MYVITVEFEVEPQHATEFCAAVVDNARRSRSSEPGCRQFDVCVAPDDPGRFFLYEVYDDRAAFDVHLATPHFRAFDPMVAPWLRRKTVRTLLRVDLAQMQGDSG